MRIKKNLCIVLAFVMFLSFGTISHAQAPDDAVQNKSQNSQSQINNGQGPNNNNGQGPNNNNGQGPNDNNGQGPNNDNGQGPNNNNGQGPNSNNGQGQKNADVFSEEECEAYFQEIQEKLENEPINPDKVPEGVMIARASFGTYPTRKGVILVTADAYKGLIPTGHAGIIYSASTIVESVAKGVTTGSNNWNSSKKTCYGVTVIGTTVAQDSAAADWCYKQRGKSYNINYLNPGTRSSFYCSQLVWAAFRDLYGINLDTTAFGIAIHPMELVNTSKTSLVYRK